MKKEKSRESNTMNVEITSAQNVATKNMARPVQVTVEFRHLEARKTKNDNKLVEFKYPISIYLGESSGSSKGKARIPFTVEAKTEPENSVFILKGESYIQGMPEEIESWIVPGKEKAPKIWKRIYQESVAMLTILARFIDAPSLSLPSSEENK